MSKLRSALLLPILAVTASVGVVGVNAAVLGPEAHLCAADAHQPAMLVRVIGLKSRTGTIRVQSYGGDPASFFDKGTWLKRIDLRTPPSGPVEVCVPVTREGIYAVSVRHDINGSGKSDMSDGGGMSGNPKLTVWDVMFKRKPAPEAVSIHVGPGIALVPVTVKYLDGGTTFRAVNGAS